MKIQAKLMQTEQDRMITREDNPEFYHTLQVAILLALKESSILTEEQFQFASGQLEVQRLYRTNCGGDRNDSGGILLPGIHGPE